MKQEKEIETVSLMIGLYCQKKHGTKKGELCPECRQLLDYVKFRRMKCRGVTKSPSARTAAFIVINRICSEKIARVMRFSGPKMVFYHPVIAFSHLAETKRQKRKLKKAEEKKA